MNSMHSDHAQQREHEEDKASDHNSAQHKNFPVRAIDGDDTHPLLIALDMYARVPLGASGKPLPPSEVSLLLRLRF